MVKSIILLLKFIIKTFTNIYNVSVKFSSNPVNPAPPGKHGITSMRPHACNSTLARRHRVHRI